MEKLLHERLREWADNYIGYCRFDGEGYCLRISTDAAGNIADEIERDYIPREQHEKEVKAIVEAQEGGSGYRSPHHIMKTYAEQSGMPMNDGESITKWLDRWFLRLPRYKDGKPVQFGDDVCYGQFQLGYPVDTIAFYDNGICEVFGNGNSFSIDPNVERFERPAPKVYDADGVECLTGQTVWDENGQKLSILSIDSEDDIHVIEDDGTNRLIAAKFLTHHEPDSLTKIRNEIDVQTNFGWALTKDLIEWRDRLTALIERGA